MKLEKGDISKVVTNAALVPGKSLSTAPAVVGKSGDVAESDNDSVTRSVYRNPVWLVAVRTAGSAKIGSVKKVSPVGAYLVHECRRFLSLRIGFQVPIRSRCLCSVQQFDPPRWRLQHHLPRLR